MTCPEGSVGARVWGKGKGSKGAQPIYLESPVVEAAMPHQWEVQVSQQNDTRCRWESND